MKTVETAPSIVCHDEGDGIHSLTIQEGKNRSIMFLSFLILDMWLNAFRAEGFHVVMI